MSYGLTANEAPYLIRRFGIASLRRKRMFDINSAVHFFSVNLRKWETKRARILVSPMRYREISNLMLPPTPFSLARKAKKRAQFIAGIKGIIGTVVLVLAFVFIVLMVFALFSTPVQSVDAEELVTPQVLIAAPIDHFSQAPNMVEATVTSYSSSRDETDDTPFISANGGHVHDGTLACPVKYAFGTEVVIEGKKYTCEDRMAKRYQNVEHFDIWAASKAEAKAYGSQDLSIEILP